MSKKNNAPQQLSPINYIKQKSRQLPIHECMVNQNWQEYGMATVLVSRRHNNGNITAAIYLVDLLCLGVKDTTYQFNLKEDEYDAFIEHFMHRGDCEKIDYLLAHNIIYTGLAFATEFEFKPHRDFTAVTQYLLDEDTDDIELIDIECGKEGKPCYVIDPADTEHKIDTIIAQLERTAGEDNFFIMDTEGDYDDETEENEDEDENQTSQQNRL